MSKHALYEKRPWLLASIVASLAYFELRDANLPELVPIACKGAAVATLAIYALLRHAGRDGQLLFLVLALGSAGDVAIEFDQNVGGACFFAGHLAAITLYLRHPRGHSSALHKLAVVALLVGTPVAAWLLPADRELALAVGLYALALGGMAASAWASSFPRYRVGGGALLFVISDLLIFARLGPLAGNPVAGTLVWPCYYVAQFLICTGVVQTLRRQNPG